MLEFNAGNNSLFRARCRTRQYLLSFTIYFLFITLLTFITFHDFFMSCENKGLETCTFQRLRSKWESQLSSLFKPYLSRSRQESNAVFAFIVMAFTAVMNSVALTWCYLGILLLVEVFILAILMTAVKAVGGHKLSINLAVISCLFNWTGMQIFDYNAFMWLKSGTLLKYINAVYLAFRKRCW